MWDLGCFGSMVAEERCFWVVLVGLGFKRGIAKMGGSRHWDCNMEKTKKKWEKSILREKVESFTSNSKRMIYVISSGELPQFLSIGLLIFEQISQLCEVSFSPKLNWWCSYLSRAVQICSHQLVDRFDIWDSVLCVIKTHHSLFLKIAILNAPNFRDSLHLR